MTSIRMLAGSALVVGLRLVYQTVGWRPSDQTLSAAGRRFHGLRCLPVRMRDGRRLYLDLRNPVAVPYLLEGDFTCERAETELVQQIVRPGDTAIDVGANVGWYSSLLSELVGPSGTVFAFEPNNAMVRLLRRLAREYPQLQVIDAGLGARNEMAELHISDNWISGSFGEVEGTVRKQESRLISLDSFLARKGMEHVDFVKLDAEGAELDILRGARRTLSREAAPMWLVEFSTEEAAQFGYHPRQIVEFFEKGAATPYRMYAVDQESHRLVPLRLPDEGSFWFNALFVPPHLAAPATF